MKKTQAFSFLIILISIAFTFAYSIPNNGKYFYMDLAKNEDD